MDRHAPRLLDALAELRVGRADAHAIQEIVTPYLLPVAEYLNLTKSSEREPTIRSRSPMDDESDSPGSE
jgi:hypothetical protein